MRSTRVSSIPFVALLLLIGSCQHGSPLDDAELQKLTSWMTGSFSSRDQAEADTNYFDIRLKMVRIWTERTDAIWLYVEQAASWALETPYRQRVYRVSRKEDGSFESAVFTLVEPFRFAGAWKDEHPLRGLTPDSLSEKVGCAVILEYKDGAFVGSTLGKECVSLLRGASHATSEVRIEQDVLTSWDRGYDAQGNQVWGAEGGPYIFRKERTDG